MYTAFIRCWASDAAKVLGLLGVGRLRFLEITAVRKTPKGGYLALLSEDQLKRLRASGYADTEKCVPFIKNINQHLVVPRLQSDDLWVPVEQFRRRDDLLQKE